MTQAQASLYVELRALVAKFSSDMDSATKKITGFEKNITGAFDNIRKVTQAALVVGGVVAVNKLIDSLGQLAARGDEAKGIAESFERLGGAAASIDQAREAMLGAVGSFDLMRIANEGLMRGIPQFNEQFGKMAEFTKRYAEATGTDAKEKLEEFTQALAAGKTKGLDKFGFALEKTANATKTQLAVFEQLQSRIDALPEASDSAAEAYGALQQAASDALTTLGMGIDDSERLTDAFRRMEDTIRSLDLRSFGTDLANLFARLIDLANIALPAVVGWVEKLSTAIDYFNMDTPMAVMTQFSKDIDAATANLEKLKKAKDAVQDNPGQSRVSKAIFGTPEDERKELQAAIDVEQKKLDLAKKNFATTARLQSEENKKANQIKEQNDAKYEAARLAREKEYADKRAKAEKDAAAKAAKAKADAEIKRIEAVQKKWADAFSKDGEDSLKKQIDEAIDTLNTADFEGLITKLEQATKQGFIDQWSEGIEIGALEFKTVEQQGEKAAQAVGDDLRTEMKKAIDDAANDLRDKMADAFDDAMDGLSGLSDVFGDDIGAIFDTLSRTLSKETKQGLITGIADAFGVDAENIGGYAASLANIAGAWMSASDIDKEYGDNRGTGAAVGGTAGTAIGAYFGNPELGNQIGTAIGKQVGKFFGRGTKDPDAIARHMIANEIEARTNALNSVAYYDSRGQLQLQNGQSYNFLEGSRDRFNNPGWADEMDSWGEKSRSTFSALGEALTKLLGITEDVGGQIGFLLGENLSKNVDNARLMVAQLGFSFEELENALFESAKFGEMTWQEFSIHVAGLQEAFKPGIEAVGDLSGAWEAFVGSGGRGMAALKGARDIGVEAMEAGAQTFEQAAQMMIAAGKDPEQVLAFFDALRARGIETFEQLKEAEDKLLGSAVGDAGNNNKALSDLWAAATESLDKYAQAIENLPTEKEIKLTVTTEMDEMSAQLINNGQMTTTASFNTNAPVQEFARGGIISGASFFNHSGGMGVAGENPGHDEAIFPLTKVGGKLSIIGEAGEGGGTYNIYIDANGDGDVEARIRRAVTEMRDQVVQSTTRVVRENHRRNRYDD